DVLDRLGEHVDGLGVRHALLDLVERTIEDAHGRRLLPLPHQAVDELAGQLAIIARIGFQRLRAGSTFSHDSLDSQTRAKVRLLDQFVNSRMAWVPRGGPGPETRPEPFRSVQNTVG